jgi:hypothetical protein
MVSHRHSEIVKGYDSIFLVVIVLSLSFLVLFVMLAHLIGLIVVTIFGAARELTRRFIGSFGFFFFLLSSFSSISSFFPLEPSSLFSCFLLI